MKKYYPLSSLCFLCLFSGLYASQETGSIPAQSPCKPPPLANMMGWELFSTLMNPEIPFPDTSKIRRTTTGAVDEQGLKETLEAQANQDIQPPYTKLSFAYVPTTALTKNTTSPGSRALTQGISLTYANNTRYFQPPQGQSIFGAHGLASAYNSMVAAIKNECVAESKLGNASKFVAMFRKLQYMILNDLYIHLTAMYTNFVLTIPPITDKEKVKGEEEKFTILREYQKLNQSHDLNTKSLIVSHLLNLIQSQMFYICNSACPLLPNSLAIRAGSILNENDQSIDPMFMILNFKDRPLFSGDDFKTTKSLHTTIDIIQRRYRSTLGQILNFFTSYTALLEKSPDDLKNFYSIATDIKDMLEGNEFARETTRLKETYAHALDDRQITEKYQNLRNAQKNLNPINPPFFFFNDEMLRSLKIIPALITELKPEAQLILWPTQIVNLANSSVHAISPQGDDLGFPAAQYDDKASKKRLFIDFITPRGVFYMQELVKEQPVKDLSIKAYFTKLMRACLGDFSQLIGLNILQPELEYIVAFVLGQPISKEVADGAAQKITLIYNAQDAYEQNQCSVKDACCVAAGKSDATNEDKDTCSYLTKRCATQLPKK